MDPLIWLIIIAGIGIASVFNYYLNRAPGAEPDDFVVGPSELGITCDCYLNLFIISGIYAIVLLLSAALFDSIAELVLTTLASFLIITVIGMIGRRRRYQEWNDLENMFIRAVPESKIIRLQDDPVDIFFDDDEYN